MGLDCLLCGIELFLKYLFEIKTCKYVQNKHIDIVAPASSSKMKFWYHRLKYSDKIDTLEAHHYPLHSDKTRNNLLIFFTCKRSNLIHILFRVGAVSLCGLGWLSFHSFVSILYFCKGGLNISRRQDIPSKDYTKKIFTSHSFADRDREIYLNCRVALWTSCSRWWPNLVVICLETGSRAAHVGVL